MCRIGQQTKHTNKTIDPCISDYLNIIELYLSLFSFASFATLRGSNSLSGLQACLSWASFQIKHFQR